MALKRYFLTLPFGLICGRIWILVFGRKNQDQTQCMRRKATEKELMSYGTLEVLIHIYLDMAG